MPNLDRDSFIACVRDAAPAGVAGADAVAVCVPIGIRLLADHLTPVVAYRRLVAPDDRMAASFLLESVEGGERQGRYSIIGAQPRSEVVAFEHEVRVTAERGGPTESRRCDDPFQVLRDHARRRRLVLPREGGSGSGSGGGGGGGGGGSLPRCFLGGWVGFAGYDTVRYGEPEKLPFRGSPRDDRALADLHFAYYDGVVVFDHVEKVVHVVAIAEVWPGDDAGRVYDEALSRLRERMTALSRHSDPLSSGVYERSAARPAPMASNMTRAEHASMLERALEYIRAGDIFQVVLGQRFERRSSADPFDVYRALRAVNPSPYMVYMQAQGCILVASSPEILCRVRRVEGEQARLAGTGRREAMVVTNRPLAGTRRRGATAEEDAALEAELLVDEKERAEHIMLVDLGRNDVGQVAEPGTVQLPAVMEIERYSHVMHISSTVTGVLREGLDAWDALRAALPVGTISGAPKIRAMQIIDELEPVRRGPYGGGMGYVGLDGQMDIALTLRTIVVPTAMRDSTGWMYHVQASGGIVADSQAEPEFQETVNKAAALARAIEVAESVFKAP